MTRTRLAAAVALVLALAGCTGHPPAQHAVAGAPPTSQLTPEPALSAAAVPATAPPAASTPAKATRAPKTTTPKT
ncbi:hypothetical protein [Amycolatopsis sp. GA6-003]|uniref:hypothetical protein n=1 Tax=Amycolatopsis sp. GA6-003 TaxID=2652444 RepID=UPI003916DF02